MALVSHYGFDLHSLIAIYIQLFMCLLYICILLGEIIICTFAIDYLYIYKLDYSYIIIRIFLYSLYNSTIA